MSLYLIVLMLLCLGALYEGFFSQKSCDRLYNLLFVIMAVMLCLRYGQGTDYLSYKYTYVNLPSFGSVEEIINDHSMLRPQAGSYGLRQTFGANPMQFSTRRTANLTDQS